MTLWGCEDVMLLGMKFSNLLVAGRQPGTLMGMPVWIALAAW